MASRESPLLSAHVILTAAADGSVPSSEAVAAARDGFRALEFDVGPFAGAGFTIAAPAAIFEGVFGVTPRRAQTGPGPSEQTLHLSTQCLPEPLRHLVERIVVE